MLIPTLKFFIKFDREPHRFNYRKMPRGIQSLIAFAQSLKNLLILHLLFFQSFIFNCFFYLLEMLTAKNLTDDLVLKMSRLIEKI